LGQPAVVHEHSQHRLMFGGRRIVLVRRLTGARRACCGAQPGVVDGQPTIVDDDDTECCQPSHCSGASTDGKTAALGNCVDVASPEHHGSEHSTPFRVGKGGSDGGRING
jgi:hypothetical protein